MHVRSVTVAMLALLMLAACTPAHIRAQTLPPSAEAMRSTTATTLAVNPAAPNAKETTVVFLVALADPARAVPAAREASAVIAAKLSTCWQGAAGRDAPPVGLKLALNADGSVSTVEVADHDRFALDTGYRRAALAAIRAFLQCGPFTLPAASYADWSSLSLRITAHPA